MAPTLYLNDFQRAARRLDRNLLAQKKLEIELGVWLESVVLRLQKSAWANKPYERPQSGAAIFFSVWINEKAVKENKILYNIHALKLRQLQGYKIASREFATAFRARFKPFEPHWPNVKTDLGPLTLMEGWEKLDRTDIGEAVFRIASKFLEIDHLVDELLEQYRYPTSR
ncbi:MAG TPA: hypothetical protein VGM41_10965 [Chitinophagaceae bacterium]|jgi:hypothetical protein